MNRAGGLQAPALLISIDKFFTIIHNFLFSPLVLVLIKKLYQTLKRVFNHISKHLEVCQLQLSNYFKPYMYCHINILFLISIFEYSKQ